MTPVSPPTEKGFTYVRSVRELGAGNGPPLLFWLLGQTNPQESITHPESAELAKKGGPDQIRCLYAHPRVVSTLAKQRVAA